MQKTEYINEVTWDKVRDKVKAINPELANIIDTYNPSKQHTFIVARYPFGMNIRHKGQSQLTNEKGVPVSLTDYPSKAVRDLLNYNPSPLALVLDKTIEIFVETTEGRSIPYKFFYPGTLFGVWEIMPMSSIKLRHNWLWSVSSGARTLFMLPKISDATAHMRLQREFQIKAYQPDNIFEHHRIFKGIADACQETHPWYSEILFFTKKWLEPQENNLGWVKLMHYCSQVAWYQMLHWSNKMTIDFNWEPLIAEVAAHKIKIRPYFFDTIKHMITIGCGTMAGFKLASNTDEAGPISLLQKIYMEQYNLKTYAPMLMHPDFLSTKNDVDNVYYSLQNPTLPEKPPSQDYLQSAMKQLRELKTIMGIYQKTIQSWDKTCDNRQFDFLNNVYYDYFHNELDQYGIVRNTYDLVKEDTALKKAMLSFKGKEFPVNASFFRGCIRIQFNKHPK